MKSQWKVKRKEPYTESGVRRLKCVRCGEPAEFQWSICADGNSYRPLCFKCDVTLNELVLKWMKHPDAEKMSRNYARTKQRNNR